MNERRGSSNLLRRVNGLYMRGGEAHESKLWAQVGKALCAWLIWKHADALIGQWEALFVLLLFIIAPELIKKFITMRFGAGGSSYTEHTERTTVKKEEPDNAVIR